MMDKLKKFLCRHSQTSIALWMVVGGYLIYLAWDIFKADKGGADMTLLTVAMIVFTIVGFLILACGALALFGGYNKESAAQRERQNGEDGLTDGEPYALTTESDEDGKDAE